MIKCIVCNSQDKIEIPYKFSDLVLSILKKYNINETYHWYLCKECGNGFQFPKQNDRVMIDMWNALDQGAYESVSKNREASSKRLFNYFYEYLSEKKSVLDIGCGHGYLLNEFKQIGFDVFGIDIDNKTKVSHDRLGIDSIIGQVEHIELQKKYDIVFSTNSIYFIQNPVKFLKKIKSYLNEDGFLCLALADFLSNSDNSLPNYGLAFYPNYYSIEYILSLAGYKVISKEKKLSNILIVCKIDEKVALPKINIFKIYFLIKTKKIRYCIFGIPVRILHKLFSDTLISKMIKKLIKY
ncbi:class I SAM-dependent methyltransferase [Aliarcobacter cryaerophilus]|uniref:class I SAM-dependent methyltransferase n=1 Tax=Aliarcobacter cryaerophilus TaxID=28198 RepID=UPI0021B34B7D|nr:class I SAM-dependent methyltransferase [Aliarcobacter cryaerophilus]MCT7495755.1 class I SAM-dependent methyltransferase [Aliarcobacter cryaerophilus]